MKALMAIMLFWALGGAALANPAPVESATTRYDADINIGPAGATLEREYFQAPQPPYSAGSLPCRLQPSLFDKTRLAQSCR